MAPKDRSVWWVWISALCAGSVARAAEQGQSPQDTGERRRLGGTTSYFTWTAERTDRNATWVTTNTATSTGGGPTTPNATVLIPVKDTTGHKTRQLSEPVIAIYFEEGTCNIMLTCTTREGGGDVKYSWQQPGKSHVLSKEPVLHITQKPDDDFLNYTCTICRGESQNSSTVSLSEHCHGASASSSIKYWVPPAFMVIALITLYFTYRKTTERASRSRAGSIDQSSDSDSKDNQAVHGAAHVIPHPEAWNQTHVETLQAKETLSTEENEQALSDPEPSPSQIDQNAAADSAAPPSDPRMSDPVRASWPLSATPAHGETTEALVTFEESSVRQSQPAPNLPFVP
ncbi:T-lymphocyte surface antigen Ly-9-like isoform X2 [Mauremys mutica]|uniref:T-lymphocyte surface antigen Ly-9-like isoform X2 n=1 Tax=Mauremys mutica TaxID=74926 RepID=UPI001D16411A|nr:T-lymphocyte surface antigen Ly-9-like isoform X2 [Mauremys mutica]